MPRKHNTAEFISRAILVHGNTYDYSDVVYIRDSDAVRIKCKKHGAFLMRPEYHLRGSGCPACKHERGNLALRLTTDAFIEKARGVHGDKYDYSNVIYVLSNKDVEIICPDHGSFYQRPNRHLSGGGCHRCKADKASLMNRKDTSLYIQECSAVHDGKYDYSLVKYINAHTKIEVVCPIHGSFMQDANHHLYGGGCPRYRNSIGEQKISRILKESEIGFIREMEFDTCVIKRKARFDFYLPEYNIIIEYHGKQHFIPWTGKQDLRAHMNLVRNDEYKSRWAKSNGYIFKEYSCFDSWDYIRRSIKGLCAYHKNNSRKT